MLADLLYPCIDALRLLVLNLLSICTPALPNSTLCLFYFAYASWTGEIDMLLPK